MAKSEYCSHCGGYHPIYVFGCPHPRQVIDTSMLCLKDTSDEIIEYSEINFEELLCKYGPEGLYDIANKLKKLADEDISDTYFS
ncbi:MAG: hypothetical protein WC979_03085 [Candidatus Pacearchaeota archaeon]|jgi:hypothetical protein|nr:hypothetical protein [Clostridia bacterium]